MKKIAYAIIFLLMVSGVFAIEQNLTDIKVQTDFPDLYVVNLRYDPYPAEPGSYTTVWLKLENKGDRDAPDVTFTLTPKYPFSLDASEKAEKKIGLLGSHQSIVINYKVRVDKGAIEGDSYLDYTYTVHKDQNLQTGSVPLHIQTMDAILSLTKVASEPAKIAPGDESTVSITIKNTADTSMKYVDVKLQLLTYATTAAGISTIELPFTPVGSGVEQTLYQLYPNEEKTFIFNLVANPTATPQPYKIPISINYYDNLGKNYSRTELVGLIVGQAPSLNVYVDSTDITDGQNNGKATIKFVNQGVGDIKFLRAKLKPSSQYTILSSDQVYIGKIDSDDYQTTDFKILVGGDASDVKKLDFDLEIEYYDQNNQKYTDEVKLSQPIFTASQVGQSSGSGFGTIIIVVVIMLALFLLYIRWEKKRKHKEE